MDKKHLFDIFLQAAEVDPDNMFVTKKAMAAMLADAVWRIIHHDSSSAEAVAETAPNNAQKAEPDTQKNDSVFSLQSDSVVREESVELLSKIVAISKTNLTDYARSGEFPATRKGRFWSFSSDEIIKKIKSCYAFQTPYVAGNRFAFLYAVQLAQKDNPQAAFLTLSQMSQATRITVSIFNSWRLKGLKSYKLPKARDYGSNTFKSNTSKRTVLLCFEDIIEFLKKGGKA